jgi:type I restriction enzyme R subunit
MDFHLQFQKMIEEYNAGSANIDEFFKRLIDFAQGLNTEDILYIAENLTEEELAVFDLLTKPKMKLTKKEELEVKKVAKDLLETLKKEKLVIEWRKKQQAKAAVKVAIEEILEGLPSCYTADIYQQKVNVVYEHVYESYFGPGQSIYAKVGLTS